MVAPLDAACGAVFPDEKRPEGAVLDALDTGTKVAVVTGSVVPLNTLPAVVNTVTPLDTGNVAVVIPAETEVPVVALDETVVAVDVACPVTVIGTVTVVTGSVLNTPTLNVVPTIPPVVDKAA